MTIYPGMDLGPYGRLSETEQVYRSNPAITNSWCGAFLQNEALAYGYFTKQWSQKDRAAFRIGSALHCKVLEPGEFSKRYVVKPTFKATKAGKEEAKEWKARHCNHVILDPRSAPSIDAMAAAIAANERASELLWGTAGEVTWRMWDPLVKLSMQCRTDAYAPGLIVDLKTTESLKSFRQSFASYGYHRQAAMYSRIVNHVTEQDHSFYFIAVEKNPPYAVGIFDLHEGALTTGRCEIAEALTRIKECVSTGVWRRDLPTVQTLEIPTYGQAV